MADEQGPKSKKRRVKDPETFRERALRAGEEEKKPKGPSRAKGGSQPIRKAAGLKPVRVAGKVIFPAYIRNSWRELRLVTWPSWKQSRQLTFAVMIFAVVFGTAIAALDYGLEKIFKNILLK